MLPDNDGLPFPADALRKSALVLDTVYTPPQTQLLRAAGARGCRVLSGVELFVHQGRATVLALARAPPRRWACFARRSRATTTNRSDVRPITQLSHACSLSET